MALSGSEVLFVNGVASNGQLSGQTEQTTTGAIAALATGGSLAPAANTNITTVGNGTLTAAAIVGRIITRSGPVAAFTDTTDTAANIIAALPADAIIGQSFEVNIVNTTIYAETVAAGLNVTLSGLSGPIPANSTARFLTTLATATTITMQLISLAYNNASGYDPSSAQTQFGSGTGTFLEEGNIYRAVYSAASAINPSATNADNVMAIFSLPANSFDGIGNRGISIQALGLFAANTHNKETKIFFNPSTATVGGTVGSGGVVIADSALQTASGVGWELNANVFKIGAAGSNTQYAQESGIAVGQTHGGVGIPVYPTATESGAIIIAVTGNASTAGAAVTDIQLNFVEINVMN